MVVVPGPEVGYRIHLDTVQNHAGIRHAILHGNAAFLRSLPHLRQPLVRQRRTCEGCVQTLPLVVHPVLLVDDKACIRLVSNEIIPKALLHRDGEGVLHDEVVAASVLPGVNIVVAPMAVVQLREPSGLLVEGAQSIGKGGDRCIPLLYTRPVPLRVPPTVKKNVLVWNVNGLGVGINVHQCLLVVDPLLCEIVVIRPVVCGVAEMLERVIGNAFCVVLGHQCTTKALHR
mmetsp:Transcript_3597/g.9207  ORF Transcript_3597/g.9207 Transcript_3597/m.9207 type:complete len:230 (+) Transcript_3597:1092-1781(+)